MSRPNLAWVRGSETYLPKGESRPVQVQHVDGDWYDGELTGWYKNPDGDWIGLVHYKAYPDPDPAASPPFLPPPAPSELRALAHYTGARPYDQIRPRPPQEGTP